MKNEQIPKDKNKENQSKTSNDRLKIIKSHYFLEKLYDYMSQKKTLEIVKYNKKLLNILNLSIEDYKVYSSTFTPIEIEIIASKNIFGKFINIINEDDELYYHIYFNDNIEEIKKKYETKEEDKVNKIKIIIDYQVRSFENLFLWCDCIESINFKKFYRNNIYNMYCMFSGCSS